VCQGLEALGYLRVRVKCQWIGRAYILRIFAIIHTLHVLRATLLPCFRGMTGARSGSYVSEAAWKSVDASSSGRAGGAGDGSGEMGDAAGMCDPCRQEQVLSREEESIVAHHRKRDWVWVEGSHDGERAAAGEAGWWRKLIPFKRQMRPEEEGEREEANEAKEEAAGEGAGQASEEFDASAPCKVRAESESGRVATGSGGLPWQAAAPGEEAEVAGDGDAQRLAGGKADLRWLRRHVYDDEGEQVRAVEGHFHSRKGVGSRVCVCVFLSLRLPKCVCLCVCVYIYILFLR